jgi:hypothetical protein
MKTPNFHDVEQLSALLDGKLSQAETVKLESRLKTDPNLQSILDDLTQTRSLLRRLPRRKAPRNFTLTPQMAGVKPPTPRSVPTLRFATMLATFLLVFSLATNTIAPHLTRQAANAPVYGMGGGGSGQDETEAQALAATEAAAATESPMLQTGPVAPQATLFPTTPAEDQANIVPTPSPEASLKAVAPPAQPAPETQRSPIPPAWQIGLLVIALVCGGLAWLISRTSERSWRAKTK